MNPTIILICALALVPISTFSQETHGPNSINPESQTIAGDAVLPAAVNDTLVILWTSGDPDVAMKMVFMYASASKKAGWWKEINLIIWGPSAKLTAENQEIQKSITSMLKAGIIMDACKACADQYGVADSLTKLGVNVRYMGGPMTAILKSDKRVVTF